MTNSPNSSCSPKHLASQAKIAEQRDMHCDLNHAALNNTNYDFTDGLKKGVTSVVKTSVDAGTNDNVVDAEKNGLKVCMDSTVKDCGNVCMDGTLKDRENVCVDAPEKEASNVCTTDIVKTEVNNGLNNSAQESLKDNLQGILTDSLNNVTASTPSINSNDVTKIVSSVPHTSKHKSLKLCKALKYISFACCGILGLSMLINVVLQHFNLYINTTSSLPYGLYKAYYFTEQSSAFTLNSSVPPILDTTLETTLEPILESPPNSPPLSPDNNEKALSQLSSQQLSTKTQSISTTESLSELSSMSYLAPFSERLTISYSKNASDYASNPSLVHSSNQSSEQDSTSSSAGKNQAQNLQSSSLTQLQTKTQSQIQDQTKIQEHSQSQTQSKAQSKNSPYINKGTLVLLCLPENWSKFAQQRGYIGQGKCPDQSAPLGKTVVAVGGDLVQFTDQGILVNHQMLPSTKYFPTDAHGRPLPRLVPDPFTTWSYKAESNLSANSSHKVIKEMVLPLDEVLVINPQLSSFDSRYFGSIKLKNIYAILSPIWVWQ